MASIFTKIIQRAVPAHIIAENDYCIAFLDISPLVAGHCLVVPKKEVDYYFDLDEQYLLEINKMAKVVAKAIESVVPCERVGVAIIGLEVPHAHMHLVPINGVGDINFKNTRVILSGDEFKDIANKIIHHLVW